VEDGWIVGALTAVRETERGLWAFLLGASDSPAEVIEAHRAYRNAVGVRKSLERLQVIRRGAGVDNIRGAVEA
jgi:hypothetical protein